MMTRAEHMTWTKGRALAELEAGGDAAVTNAFASLVSDLRKHPELADHAAIELGLGEMLLGGLNTRESMRAWIEGCA